MTEHAVWTFMVTGGGPFALTVPQNPTLEHRGGMTIWKLVGTEILADQVEADILAFGGTVKRHTEVQTPELIEGRMKLPD